MGTRLAKKGQGIRPRCEPVREGLRFPPGVFFLFEPDPEYTGAGRPE